MGQKPPAFQFYPRNWLTGRTVLKMTEKQQGQFLHLLSHAWLEDEPGTLPMPIEMAAKLVGWKTAKLRSFLEQFPTTFVPNSGPNRDRFENSFIHSQWVKYQEISNKRSLAASKSSANVSHTSRSASEVAFASAQSSTKSTTGPPQPRPNSHATCGNVENKSETTKPQARYVEVSRLIPEALRIIGRAKAMGKPSTSADVREDLKAWAARNGLAYDSDAVSKAITAAEGRAK